jgi:hypothetical protein
MGETQPVFAHKYQTNKRNAGRRTPSPRFEFGLIRDLTCFLRGFGAV